MPSPKMKYFLWLDVFFLCEFVIEVYVALSEPSCRCNFYNSIFSLACNSLPATLTVVLGAVENALAALQVVEAPKSRCIQGFGRRGAWKGFAIGSTYYVIIEVAAYLVVLGIFGAVDLTTLSVMLGIEIFKTFGSFPARFNVLTWRLKCPRTNSPIGDVEDEEASTIVGAAFVAGCVYVRMHVQEVLMFAMYLGEVNF